MLFALVTVWLAYQRTLHFAILMRHTLIEQPYRMQFNACMLAPLSRMFSPVA